MPTSELLINPINSATSSICDPRSENLRVILILSHSSRTDLRQAIRQSYGNVTSLNSHTLNGKFTKFFLVGEINDERHEESLRAENEKYHDIIVANIAEDSFSTTLKILIGMKFASCFCPKAEYFIKAKDDDYIRLKLLDKIISDEQDALNKRNEKRNRKSLARNLEVPGKLYMGNCGIIKVQRPDPKNDSKSSWLVPYDQYSEYSYPPYCAGSLYIISMGAIRNLAQDCPHTCIGLEPRNREENQEKPCFWTFEDTFIGSCIFFTQKDVNRVNVQYRSAVFTGSSKYRDRLDPEMHIVVRGLATYVDMVEAHQYYTERNLV